MTGYILYEGPSMYDGQPIVAVATCVARKSKNIKTGNMIQVIIMAQDEPPHEAQKSGLDSAVCGDCKQRPSQGGGCYVRTEQSILAAWKAWKAGKYQWWDFETPFKKPIRIGAYGDGLAMPQWITEAIVAAAEHGWTAYSHAWDWPGNEWAAAYYMASVEIAEEYDKASAAGWRTFWVYRDPETWDDSLSLMGTIPCPADKGVQCADCLLCSGNRGRGRCSIRIQAHGAKAKQVHQLKG